LTSFDYFDLNRNDGNTITKPIASQIEHLFLDTIQKKGGQWD